MRTSPFDSVAEIYDRVRPGYPAEFFDDIFLALPKTTGGSPGVLEVGAGTGKATAELLRRGARVTAVELGPALGDYLRRKFAGQEIEVLTQGFEEASIGSESYDGLVAAMAWDWIDGDQRVERAARALKPGGIIAVLAYTQVNSEADRGFFERCFPVYQKHRPGEARTETPEADFTPPTAEELRTSGHFEEIRVLRRRWDQRYETGVYADLVRSYSNSQEMAPGPREALIADLCALIEAEFDGYVVRPLVATMVVAIKRG